MSNLVVKLKGGNTAMVTADIKESMAIEGKLVSSMTKEAVTVELINGKYLVTKLIGYSSM